MKTTFLTVHILKLLVRLWHHLSRRRQRQLCLLLGLMLVSAFMEVVSLGAVLPFLGILTEPNRVFIHPIVAGVANAWGITSTDTLVLPLTVAFATLALIAGAIRLLLSWASNRLAYTCGADLSIEVYRRTLYQPYRIHISRNSSEVISGISSKISGAVSVLQQLLILISSVVLLLAIILALIAINPEVALMAAFGFGGSYGLVSWLSRHRLYLNSQRIAYEQTQVLKALQEGLGGIRDVLIDNTQSIYCDIYRKADLPLRRAQGNNIFIGQSPRYVMEALGMALIAVLAYGLSRQPGGVTTNLPVLGALALGAQRLIPALQLSYNAWSSIVGYKYSLIDVIELLDQPLPFDVLQPTPAPLPFKDSIHFSGVRFRYTSNSPWVLDDINLNIPKGARIGFVGSTGSGKSTMLDLLMGLLLPTEGEIMVDRNPVNNNCLRAWQRNIAHVPQSIYLADTTFAENIAFGVEHENIDFNRVRQAAEQAQIADFINNHPEGYNAFVGERGIRLSGGQCQRIGIARALYKQANVLILDEATSALDNTTEQSVMNAIEGLNRDLTILIVAHRLTTVRRCDTIVVLENARLVAHGSYDQLQKSSLVFNKMLLKSE